jgi:hypothetical protein
MIQTSKDMPWVTMIIVKATGDIDLLNKKYSIKNACHGKYDL